MSYMLHFGCCALVFIFVLNFKKHKLVTAVTLFCTPLMRPQKLKYDHLEIEQ